jgi:DNA-binding winged helix-turn-helix (wHTH) protein
LEQVTDSRLDQPDLAAMMARFLQQGLDALAVFRNASETSLPAQFRSRGVVFELAPVRGPVGSPEAPNGQGEVLLVIISNTARAQEALSTSTSGHTIAAPDAAPSTAASIGEHSAPKPGDRARVAGLTIDFARHVALFQESVVPLARREFDVMAALIRHRGRVMAPEEIMSECGGMATSRQHAAAQVRVHILRVRHKLAAAKVRPGLITTVRGVGYVIEASQYEKDEPAGNSSSWPDG